MSRDGLIKLLGALLLGAATWWFVQNTEWVDKPVEGEFQGEARTNDLYVVQQLARRLGVRSETSDNLDRWPTAGATLWLDSWHWDLFPERAQRLQRWVEAGGHLVIEAHLLDKEHMQPWIPITAADPPRVEEDGDDEGDEVSEDVQAVEDKASAAPQPARPASAARPWRRCHALRELAGVPRAFADREVLAVCSRTYPLLHTTAQPVWGLEDEVGTRVLRVRVGQGLVTVTQLARWGNHDLLNDDHALLAVATLGLRPGAEVWWVTEESRPPLLALVWQRGWVVLVLAGLALLAALWRGAVRFGPPLVAGDPARRSMAEQIRGTAGFLQAHGRDTLVRAQLRALDDAARLHVRDYTRLDPLARAQALAQATNLPADEVTRALNATWRRSTGDFLWTLDTLETLRRRLKTQARPSGAPSDQQG